MMKKQIFNISKFFPVFIVVFVVGGIVSPNIASAEWFEILNPLTWITSAAGALSIGVLELTTYLTYLSGIFLNYVARYAVVDMKTSLEGIGSIDVAWRTIRDLANMSFIFVLLYAAIMTMIGKGSETRRTIVMVIVVAILINFSLFFTKLVIDASNILAITFYDSIAPNALIDAGDTSITNAFGVNVGISNSLMQSLKIQSLYDVSDVNYGVSDMLIVGVMGTVISLVAAFVFFAIAILLIIRFVILILVMILSPLAFVGLVLPQASKYTSQWKNALIGQAFFAPIYFLLTWIVIVIARGLTLGGNMAAAINGVVGANGASAPDPGAVGAIVNFIVVIVLLISSIIIAKEWANMAPGGVSKLTNWAMGAAGGATLGVAGRFGRGTIGRAGQAIGESETMKKALAWSSSRGGLLGGATGIGSRAIISGGRKVGDSSFDLRATGLGGTLDAGKAGGKGGFAEFRKKKSEEEAKFAATLGASDKTIAKAQKALDEASTQEEKDSAQAILDKLKGVKKEDMEKKEKEAFQKDPIVKTKEDLNKMDREIKQKEKEAADIKIIELRKEREKEVDAMKKGFEKIREASETRREEIKKQFRNKAGEIEPIKSIGEDRKDLFAKATEKSLWNKIQGYNYVAAAQIRKGKKSAKDLIEEAMKETGEKTEEDKTENKGGSGEEKKTS